MEQEMREFSPIEIRAATEQFLCKRYKNQKWFPKIQQTVQKSEEKKYQYWLRQYQMTKDKVSVLLENLMCSGTLVHDIFQTFIKRNLNEKYQQQSVYRQSLANQSFASILSVCHKSIAESFTKETEIVELVNLKDDINSFVQFLSLLIDRLYGIPSQENKEQIFKYNQAIMEQLFKDSNFYEKIKTIYQNHLVKEQLKYKQGLMYMAHENIQNKDVPENVREQNLTIIVSNLKNISKFKTPQNKIDCLLQFNQEVGKLLRTGYSADDYIPMLIFVLVSAQYYDLIVELKMIEHYIDDNSRNSNVGYLLISLEIAQKKNYCPQTSPHKSSRFFGYSQHTFILENPNEYAVQFHFEFEKFRITPIKGEVGPGQKINFQLTYAPIQAEVVVASVILNIQHEDPRVIKISGIGKYPFLQINTKKLNFESLLIGKSLTKELTIKNSSEVTASFVLQKVIDDEFKENAFNLDFNQGVIPPKSTFLIKVTYTPQILHVSVIRYKILCQGGNELIFECIGNASQHLVYLSEKSINFGEIKIGNQAKQLLTVHNDSDLNTNYQIYSDTGNIFSFNKVKGTSPAKGFDRIIITFIPKNQICYYERVYVIISNQLLYVDLIGTCYDLLIKPIPLQQIHIDNFRRRVIQGMLSEVDFKYMENSFLMQINQQQYQTNLQGDWIESPNQTVLFKELMLSPQSDHRLIQFSEEFMDFGYTEAMQSSGVRDLILHNKLNCKLTFFWTIQNHQTVDGDKLPVFLVYPETQSVHARQSCRFQISFRPTKSSYYYFQDIQFFAIKYNPNLTKKIVENMKRNTQIGDSFINNLKLSQTAISNPKQQDFSSKEMIPTFSGRLACVGHSFGINSQPYIPIVEFRPSQRVYFPPCTIQESVYQTVEFLNKSDTPIYFKFSPDISKTFKIYPNQGLITGKSSQILILEFVPLENKAYNQNLTCHMNHQSSNQISLNVVGYCSSPCLKLQNEGKVFFPPSFVGVYSRQKITVHNQSRVLMQYQVQIPEKYSNELYIEPANGQIRPNETLHLDCQFIPYKKNKEYRIKVPLLAQEILSPTQSLIGYHIPGSGHPDHPIESRQPTELQYLFEIFGAGSDGFLKLSQKKLDFGIIKVNFNDKQYATLINESNCTFYVELNLRYKNKDKDTQKDKEKEKLDIKMQNLIQKSFTLDIQNAIIAANSKLDIGIMFNPIEVCEFDLILDVVATEKNPKASRGPGQTIKKIVSQKCKLEVRARGNYPLLKIADVRNDSISVATLWENFQINQINVELAKDLNELEQKFLKIEQLTYKEAQHLQKALKSYDWNFGYLPSKPVIKSRKIVITIQNIGGTELEWQFKLPSDHQIDLEPWADPGEPTEEDTFEKAILERNIFQIKPKGGVIQPGSFKDIELIYTPSNFDSEITKKNNLSNESHFLRVVLQILNGKPLVLNLKGTTLAPLEGLLAVKKTVFTLPETPVGLLQPVKYPIEIQNVGSSKVNYTTEIQELNDKGEIIDSQFFVFGVTPQGSLPAGEKQYLYCSFKPLEQKVYHFQLLIQVSDMVRQIKPVILSVSGRGYADQPSKNDKGNVQEIPRQRSHQSPIGSKVFFSLEEIDFGELLPQKSAHRMIILYNQSNDRKFNYDFGSQLKLSSYEQGLCCGDEFVIDPSQGEVEPQSFIELKLTLTSATTPSVYEGECECTITWETKSNGINTSQVSQNSQVITVDKEILFLRIKKRSSLNVELVNSFKQPPPPIHNPMAHPFQQLLSQIITEVLTDSNTDQILKGIDQQPINVFEPEDDSSDIKELQFQRDYKDFRTMFLEEEFIELTDLIMENTFFNIIQETTRKECDLLRISKTFVTPAK
ncbi:hypothetical protein pb186bvf_009972 [Paramecium bursaria]